MELKCTSTAFQCTAAALYGFRAETPLFASNRAKMGAPLSDMSAIFICNNFCYLLKMSFQSLTLAVEKLQRGQRINTNTWIMFCVLQRTELLKPTSLPSNKDNSNFTIRPCPLQPLPPYALSPHIIDLLQVLHQISTVHSYKRKNKPCQIQVPQQTEALVR